MRDRVCVLVDDMIDTGGTIVTAAETLFDYGASQVLVAATHGVLSDPATTSMTPQGRESDGGAPAAPRSYCRRR